MSREAIERAVKHVGSQRALAEGIRRFMKSRTFSQQTVSYWIKNDVAVEAEYWPAIEHVTEGEVTRSDLRPDVFLGKSRGAAA